MKTPVEPQGELRLKGEKLLQAAMDYWEEYKAAFGAAAVVWVTDTDGRMVILTRGEYRSTLMRNIDSLERYCDEDLRSYDESDTRP